MTEHRPHITEYKKKEVEEVKKLFQEYPVVAIVNLESLPAKQLQRMKKKLRGTMVLKHTRKRFIQLAIDQLENKQNIQALKEKLVGVPALIFTKEDPFNVFKILKKSESNAPAKGGQLAPDDLTMPAGPTSFTPGPMIGELGQLGLKTEIKEGKIHIREDKVLVKKGEPISAKIAELLVKVGIEPMKIGMNLLYTYKDGEILGREVLDIDEEKYWEQIKAAHMDAFNVALFIAYPTPETIEFLVQKASRESTALAKTANVQTSETIKETIGEAERAATAIEQQMPETPAVEAEPVTQEKPKEEIKKEEQQEKHSLSKETGAIPMTETAEPIEKKKTDEEVAQEVLRQLTEGKIKKQMQASQQHHSPQTTAAEKELNNIINNLKDKKSQKK